MSTFPVTMADGSEFNLTLAIVKGKGETRTVKDADGNNVPKKQQKPIVPGVIAIIPDREEDGEGWKVANAAVRRAKMLKVEKKVDNIGKALELLVKLLNPKITSATETDKDQVMEYLNTNVDAVEGAFNVNLAGTVDSMRTPFTLRKVA